jgi:outer membrane protein OmpA-like peptidoglycan-associated protein
MTRSLLVALALVGLACETAKQNAYDEEYRRLEEEARAKHGEASRYAAVIYFETGSAALDADDQRELRWFADKLAAYPQANVDVQGFADSTGSETTNSRLSFERAQAVSAYLGTLGIERSRIHTAALSTTSPAASNATSKGRKSNRRVEVTVR